MGKYLSILAVGALALTACTSEDVVEDVSTTPITFRNVVSKPSRATDLTSGNMEKFNVFGFYTMPENAMNAHSVFYNTAVVSPGATGKWTYDEATRYWVPGATYYFYAYSCGNDSELKPSYGSFTLDMSNENGGKSAENRTLKITDYLCNNSHQHDLVFASKSVSEVPTGYNEAVSLDFKHILTKVQAHFTNTFSDEYDVVVKDVQFKNICNEGDYDFNTGWSGVKQNKDNATDVSLMDALNGAIVADGNYITIKNEKKDGNQVYGESKTAFVLPKKYTDNVTLYIVIDVMYKEDIIIKNKVLTASLKPNWESGKYYIYNIELNPEVLKMDGITFGVIKVNGWDEPTNKEDITVVP